MGSVRGFEMQFDTIVLLALALFVLLLAGAFYSGGFRSLGGKTMEFAAKSSPSSATAGQIANCNRLCGAITSCSESGPIEQFLTSECSSVVQCAMAQECVACDAPDPELC